jgi:hypothetical protein
MAVNPAMSEAEEFKVHCRAAGGEAGVELSDTFRETRPAVETEFTDNDNEFDWAAQVLTKPMLVPTTNIRYRKRRALKVTKPPLPHEHSRRTLLWPANGSRSSSVRFFVRTPSTSGHVLLENRMPV